ncbi:MAG: GDCCVxC domain-containing (seleno)protein [Burkholderiales bacterium]
MSEVVLESTLTCPACGYASAETMPTDACLFFWACPYCKEVAKPKRGDCCVFCSYGSVPCPPVQEQRGGGCAHPGDLG